MTQGNRVYRIQLHATLSGQLAGGPGDRMWWAHVLNVGNGCSYSISHACTLIDPVRQSA
jgi:uncharacterized protein YgfB (UPF0149 family)